MEIQDYWRVTQIVRDIPENKGFPTSLVNELLRVLFQISRNASLTISQMPCVELIHRGHQGGMGKSRDPNIYRRRESPESYCGECQLPVCMIRDKKMAAQIGLDQRIVIPADQLIDL